MRLSNIKRLERYCNRNPYERSLRVYYGNEILLHHIINVSIDDTATHTIAERTNPAGKHHEDIDYI